MAGGFKVDHQPILAPGLHPLSVEELEAICVDAFPDSATRKPLSKAMRKFLEKLSAVNLPCELWVDGSYLTQKLDPEDIDVFVCIPPSLNGQLSDEQKLLVHMVNSDAGFIDGIDSFAFFQLDLGHPDRHTEWDDRSGWMEHCGTERNSDWLKGVAVILAGETDVGIRLRR